MRRGLLSRGRQNALGRGEEFFESCRGLVLEVELGPEEGRCACLSVANATCTHPSRV